MIIGHFERCIWSKGGIASYVRRIGYAQTADGHQVYYFSFLACDPSDPEQIPIVVSDEQELFAVAQKLGLDILHLHSPLKALPPENLAVVRTIHGHAPYCPSGSKYLETKMLPCNRPYSVFGCLQERFSSHCGSVRPERLWEDFKLTWREMKHLPKMTVITVSQFLKDQMLEAGYPEQNIQVLPLFAPAQEVQASMSQDRIPHFVFLGQLIPPKGVAWLLRAFREVRVPAHLDIAGEGYQKVELENLAQQLGLHERVTFHGWVAPEQVNNLLTAARALVFPSLWHEPAGWGTLEAYACGRPVIASKVGGIVEYVQSGSTGLLVEPSQISGLATAIETLATDYNLAQNLGATGWKMIRENYTLAGHLQQLTAIYTSTLKVEVLR